MQTSSVCPDCSRRGRSGASRAPRRGGRLAAEELGRAERFGAGGAIGAALHACALAEPEAAARVALCRARSVGARRQGNREIAHALFVSVKTVETHLAAAYRKLGIRARSDIAPALAAA